MAKRRRHDPNRFQKQDNERLFSFGPTRRYAFKWGLLAGASGGLFMIRPEIFWQIVGIAVVVFMSNYHINKASRYIPRWHATVISFLGVLIGMFSIIIIGSIILFYIQNPVSIEGGS